MISDRTLKQLVRSDRMVLLWGDLVRVAIGYVVVGLIALVLGYQAIVVRLMFSGLNMNDFGKFYYSARYFLDGQDMYGPSPATEIPVGENESRQFWNMNPPHFHLLLLPLAGRSPGWALTIWGAFNLLALALAMWIVTTELNLKWTTAGTLWSVLFSVANASTGAIVVTGQLTFLILLCLTLAWRAARRSRWVSAAIWLGVLASVKPFLGLFGVLFLLRGRLTAAVGMAATACICMAAGIVVFGVSSYLAWIDALRLADWTWPPMNGAIAGFFARSLSLSPIFTPLFEGDSLVPVLTAAATLLVLAIAFKSLTSADRQPVDKDFLVLLLTTLLVTPLGWIYYLWLILGPALACWRPNHRWNAIHLIVASFTLVCLMCPLPLTGIWLGQSWAAPTIGSAYFWTTLGLWLLVVIPDGPFSARRTPYDADYRTIDVPLTSPGVASPRSPRIVGTTSK